MRSPDSLAALRGSVAAAGWDAVLATVAAAHGFASDPGGSALEPWRDPAAARHLGAVHESLLAGQDRVRRGSFYTPPSLVGWVLDRALGDLDRDDDAVTVLDPACGTGNFLVEVVRRLGPASVARVHGTDLDPVAAAITRLLLRVEAPDADPALIEQTVRVADGLGEHPAAPYDVVVGNPPFGGRLRPRGPVVAGAPAAYTDTSAVFLLRALDLVSDGGTVALVQPLSLLAARDAAPVRDAVRTRGTVSDLWASPEPVFAGTSVLTCAPVVRVGDHGAKRDGVELPEGEWGPVVAPAFGIPAARPATRGVVGDVARCVADFRDQYYGLAPHLRDGGPGVPLVTAGLVDPARCRWGEVPTRFARSAWHAPTVDLDALRAEGSLTAWATERLVPKVLVAAQGRVVEAVVDADGAWLPSVPVVSVVPRDPDDPDRLWHLLAVLLSPPVVAGAAARYLGAGLSASAVKLSARQVAALPLPADTAAWEEGAVLARAAQAVDDAERPAALRRLAEQMCTAYADDTALSWWLQRAETRVRRAGRVPTFSEAPRGVHVTTTPLKLPGGV